MSAQSIPALLTVADYEKLPGRSDGGWELHHGEAVFVTFPKIRHKNLQHRIRRLFEQICAPLPYFVDSKYPYRPLPEHELWGADVAVISDARHYAASEAESWLDGSPELTIEVKSPSNTKADLHDHAMTTLAGEGAVEFWIVDPKTQSVTVYNKKSGIHIYTIEHAVPLPYLHDQRLLVSEIFQKVPETGR